MTAMTSGSVESNSSNSKYPEWRPGSPAITCPPAISTSSGTQLPACMGGSIHSTQATRGRLSNPAELARSAPSRVFNSATSSRPRSGIPSAPATASMSSNTSPSAMGARGTIRGCERTTSQTASSTSRRLTAQTSHWVWVTITVGASSSRRRPSTRYTDSASPTISRTWRSMSRLDAAAIHLGRGTDGETQDLWREVTFVGTPDETVLHAERADDLGRAGDQRDDARLAQCAALSVGTVEGCQRGISDRFAESHRAEQQRQEDRHADEAVAEEGDGLHVAVDEPGQVHRIAEGRRRTPRQRSW